MDDSQVLERLRSVRSDGAPSLADFPQRALAAGRRTRRRRRLVAAGASGTVLAGAAALAVVLAQGGTVADRAISMTPADGAGEQDATAPPVAGGSGGDEVDVLATQLGLDFVVDDDHRVVVVPGSPSAAGLPAGYEFSLGAWTSARGNDEMATMCGPGGVAEQMFTPCTDLRMADERRATMSWVRHYGGPASHAEGRVGHELKVIFAQRDGDFVVADAVVNRPAAGSTAAVQDAARTWLAGLAPRIGKALASRQMDQVPRPDGTPSDRRALQAALGPDFAEDSEGHLSVRPGSELERTLPAGYRAAADVTSGKGEGQAALTWFCEHLGDAHLSASDCATKVLADGRTVHIRWKTTTPGPNSYEYGQVLQVLYIQPDDDIVVTSVRVSEDAGGSTAERRDQARWWLEDLQPNLIAAATDPGVEPMGPAPAG